MMWFALGTAIVIELGPLWPYALRPIPPKLWIAPALADDDQDHLIIVGVLTIELAGVPSLGTN